MSSLAVAAMARLCPSLSQRTFLHNRRSWLIPVLSCNYAKTAEEKLGLDKPKRPITPFLKFALQMRPALKAKNPDLKSIDLMKLASKHWQQLGGDVKSKMTKEFQENMEDYRKVIATYQASLTDIQKEDLLRTKEEIAAAKDKRKLRAEMKELGRPKRPMSSYLLFCQTEKNHFGSLGIKEYQTRMKEKWNALSSSEKAKWQAKATALMDQYRLDRLKWEEKMVEQGHIEHALAKKKENPVNKKSKTKADE